MGRHVRPQIRIPEDQLRDYLEAQRVVIVCSLDGDGTAHAMPMWYVLDASGRPVVTTAAKSQKAVNLRRDPRVTWLVESGERYDELTGVQAKGEAQTFDDLDRLIEIACAIDLKYRGVPATGERLRELERQMRKRIGIVLPTTSILSWDHRRLSAVAAVRPS